MKTNDKKQTKEEYVVDEKKGRKNTRPRKSKSNREARSCDTHPRTNDVSWYATDSSILNSAASYSFNNPLGNSLRISELTNLHSSINISNLTVLDNSVPGVMRLNYVPTIGYSNNNASPINIAARKLYSTIRSANSGAKNYEPDDLMKYIMAVDSIYSYYAFMVRLYGICSMYSSVNRYWPRVILQTMGFAPDTLMANLADFRYYINAYAAKANTLSVPNELNIFKRHFFMNMGMWKDGPSDKSQTYYFAPIYLYELDETDTPASLVPVTMPLAGDSRNVQWLMNTGNNLLQQVLSSEDMGIISGDLLKCFGEGGMSKLPNMEANYETIPTYDAAVLHQIHNATFVGQGFEAPANKNNWKITAITAPSTEAGAIVQTPHVRLGINDTTWQYMGSAIAHIVDVHGIENPDPEIVMEVTRLITHAKVYKEESNMVVTLSAYGSEVLTTWQIYRMVGSEATHVATGSSALTVDETIAPSALETFNLHPIVTLGEFITSTADKIGFKVGIEPIFADLENYTIMSNADLVKLHETALLGLYNVPKFGSYMANKLR